MEAREEMLDLERMWRERPLNDSFYRRHRESKWGERIREEVIRGIEQRMPEAIEDGILFLEAHSQFKRNGEVLAEDFSGCSIAVAFAGSVVD